MLLTDYLLYPTACHTNKGPKIRAYILRTLQPYKFQLAQQTPIKIPNRNKVKIINLDLVFLPSL